MSLRTADGDEASFPLRQVQGRQVAAAVPWRKTRSARGQAHYPGYFWSATMGGHVIYESRLELARLLLADFDRDVAAIAAQPFLLQVRIAGTARPVEALAASARKAGIRVRHGITGRAHPLAALGGPGAFPADVWNIFRSPAPASHDRSTSRISTTLTSRNTIPRTSKSDDLQASEQESDQNPRHDTPGGSITGNQVVPCSWQATRVSGHCKCSP